MVDALEPDGPMSYENWRACLRGVEQESLFEYPLFSDSMLRGRWHLEGSPYELVGVLRETADIPRAAAALLRLRYAKESHWSASRSTPPAYHGGSVHDEVTALIAVCLGARIKPARYYTRRWGFGNDPLGEPVCNEEPLRVPTTSQSILRPRGPVSLLDLAPLARFPRLEPRSASALVLAARSYQEAVWAADQDPSYSWLLLVSAVETAATCWSGLLASPVERLRTSRPRLYDLLAEAGGEDLAVKAAEQIADYMGATRKFRDFLITFMPPPPSDRPSVDYCIPWEERYLKRALEKVYSFRSRALHGGVAFPAPMCAPLNDIEERPRWVSSTDQDRRVWWAKDVPMLHHTFEYIVRGALQRWWGQLQAEHGVEQ